MYHIYHGGIMTTYDSRQYHEVVKKMTDSSVIIVYSTNQCIIGPANNFIIYIGLDTVLRYYTNDNYNCNYDFEFECADNIGDDCCNLSKRGHEYGCIINNFIATYTNDIKNLNVDTFKIITNKILTTFPLYVEMCNNIEEMCNNFKESIMHVNTKSAVKK